MVPKADLDTLKAARDILLRVGTHGHDLLETIESLEDANRDELAGADPETRLLGAVAELAGVYVNVGGETCGELQVAIQAVVAAADAYVDPAARSAVEIMSFVVPVVFDIHTRDALDTDAYPECSCCGARWKVIRDQATIERVHAWDCELWARTSEAR